MRLLPAEWHPQAFVQLTWLHPDTDWAPIIDETYECFIRIAQQIGTFETSILPYEDCCTIFVAKHPVTKPNLNIIKRSEKRLSERIDELYQKAMESDEVIIVR